MKKLLIILIAAMFLVACGNDATEEVEADYTTAEFEAALNKGDDLTGKIVDVEIDELVPDSAFGFNLQAGEHLNFVSSKNPGKKAGEKMTVEIEEVENVIGSYVIKYKMK